jgi:hypothetical protein
MASIDELFSDRDFLKMLGQTGAGLDPEGVGAALGVPATKWVERDAAAEHAEAQREQQNRMFNMLLKALAGNTNITGIDLDETGNVSRIKGSAPKPNESGQTNVESLDMTDDSASESTDTSGSSGLLDLDSTIDSLFNSLMGE